MKKLFYFGCFTAAAALLSSTSNSRMSFELKEQDPHDENRVTRTAWLTFGQSSGGEQVTDDTSSCDGLSASVSKLKNQSKPLQWSPSGGLYQDALYNSVDPFESFPVFHLAELDHINLPNLDIPWHRIKIPNFDFSRKSVHPCPADQAEQDDPSLVPETVAETENPAHTPAEDVEEGVEEEVEQPDNQPASPVEEFFAEEMYLPAEPILISEVEATPLFAEPHQTQLPAAQKPREVKLVNPKYERFYELPRAWMIKTIQRHGKPAKNMHTPLPLQAEAVFIQTGPSASDIAEELISQLNHLTPRKPGLSPVKFVVGEKQEEAVNCLKRQKTQRSTRTEDLQAVQDQLDLDLLNITGHETQFNLAYQKIIDFLNVPATPVKEAPAVEDTINSGALRAKKRILNKVTAPTRVLFKSPAKQFHTPEVLKRAQRFAAQIAPSSPATTDAEWATDARPEHYGDVEYLQMRASVMKRELDYKDQGRKGSNEQTTPVRPKLKNYGSKNPMQILRERRQALAPESPDRSDDFNSPPVKISPLRTYPDLSESPEASPIRQLHFAQDDQENIALNRQVKKSCKPKEKNFFQRLFSKPKAAKKRKPEEPEEIELTSINFIRANYSPYSSLDEKD